MGIERDEQITRTTNVFLIHHIDTRKLLDFLGQVYFYPLSDRNLRFEYRKIVTLAEDAFEQIFNQGGTPKLDNGVRAYLHYGNKEFPNKGLYLASRNPGLSRSIRTSPEFGEGVLIREDMIRGSDGVLNEERLHILVKLVLRDEKSLIVNPFGRPMRLMGESGRSCSIAEFDHEFCRQIGNNSGFTLRIEMTAKTYVLVDGEPGITDSKNLYLVGNTDCENKCFLLSASRARALYHKYPVRYQKDGRKNPRNWIYGGTKADALDSGEEDDRATMLSRFLSDSEKKLHDAGCSLEPQRRSLGKCKIANEKKVKNYVKQKLNESVAKACIPPFIPILEEGVLPVIDLRADTDRTPGTRDLVDTLVAAKKSKNMDLFFDCHGNLRKGVALNVSGHAEHETAIAILHNKEFYAKTKTDDPYNPSRMGWQRLTVEDALDDKETLPAIFPTTLRELAIKQMLTSGTPWRRFVVEPLWESLSGIEVCSAGKPGKKYKRWCISFPREDRDVMYRQFDITASSCWHTAYIENEFLLPHEHGDPNNHYAFIRKDDMVIMVRLGGVAEHVIYDAEALHKPYKERVKDMRPLFTGVHLCAVDLDRELFYMTGGVHSFNGKTGAKRHPSSFSAWVLGGSVQQARQLIEPLLYPHSNRLGDYPARPFPIGFASDLFDLYESRLEKE